MISKRCLYAGCLVSSFLIAVIAGAHPTWAEEGSDEPRLLITATASEKLSAELVAAKITGGKLIGLGKDGRAAVELSAEQQANVAKLEGVELGDLVTSEELDQEFDEFIVIYEPGQVVANVTIKAAGLEIVSQNQEGNFIVVRAAGGITAAEIQSLEDDEAVTFVEPNYIVRLIPPVDGEPGDLQVGAEDADDDAAESGDVSVANIPNDKYFNKLWGMTNIRAPKAWNTVRTSPVIVAVIDTGVDYSHPDLKANMWVNLAEKNGKANVDDDKNGVVDDIYGANFIPKTPSGNPMDDNRHGTHCAGTIGGVGNNRIGVAGVNWKVKIMAVKFLSAGGSGRISDAIECVDYARRNGARIMSNSWGGGGYNKAMDQAIERARKARILFVAAAGNRPLDNDKKPHYPSSYKHNNVFAIGSIESNNKKSSFSAFGKTSVDIFAPGRTIYSTLPNNRYGSLTGTSMATPHAAGAAALFLGHVQYGKYSPLSAKSFLMSRARRHSSLSGLCVTGGTLDIGFLEQAVTTIVAQQAYNHFRYVTIKKNMTIASVSFTLPTTMFVHFTAQTTARLVSTKEVTIANGLYLGSSPNAVYSYSLRRVQFDAKNDVQPISTSFGLRLRRGRHTIRWNVWPGSGQLRTDSGTIMVEAFGAKAGGILVLTEVPEVVEITDDGKIKRQITTFEELDGVE